MCASLLPTKLATVRGFSRRQDGIYTLSTIAVHHAYSLDFRGEDRVDFPQSSRLGDRSVPGFSGVRKSGSCSWEGLVHSTRQLQVRRWAIWLVKCFQGWETREQVLGLGDRVLVSCSIFGQWEDGIHMKNTGKRIFVAIIFAVLASLPLVVSAGAFYSQR